MNENPSHDPRKDSIFSIISETSNFDYSTIHNNEHKGSIAFILNAITTRQLSIASTDAKILIDRNAVDWEDLKNDYGHELPETYNKEKVIKSVKQYYKQLSILGCIVSILPLIKSIRNYSFRRNIFYDLIAGLTLAIINIPEAIANGYLAGLGPVNGLYVSFFPILIYALMGTSHHTSIGTFSIMSVMASDVVLRVQEDYIGTNQTTAAEFSPLEILTSLCLLCGLIQFVLGCLHLGALSVLLSDTMISAFTSAAAVHVLTSYFPVLFDINLPQIKYTSFRIFEEWIEFFSKIHETNFITFGISVISLTVLVLFNELIEPMLKSRFKFKIPIPTDLLLIIIMTSISFKLNLNKEHSVDVIGTIPIGFQTPTLPRLELFPIILRDAVEISLVAYAVSLSMAKVYAKKHKYRIDPNQELLAFGTSNIFSSFFNCFPSSPSLSRTSVLDKFGVKSQLANIFSVIIILFFILFIDQLLYHLPKAILSSIIIVSLKSMFMQIKDFKRVFKISKLEGISWVITFLSVIIFDVDIGLLVGIAFSLIIIIMRLSIPYNGIMGRLQNSELYVDINHYKDSAELSGIKIFYYSCPLIFINSEHFKESLCRKVLKISSNDIIMSEDHTRGKSTINTIIIDCSTIFYMDSTGVQTIIDIINELRKIRINVLLASCHESVKYKLEKTKYFDKHSIYASIHDAVVKTLAINELTSSSA